MIRQCADCNRIYNDTESTTICPHQLIMPREDLDRKIAALQLAGKWVRFNHQTEEDRMRVMGITFDGFILLYKFPGEFAPHLFVITENQEPA